MFTVDINVLVFLVLWSLLVLLCLFMFQAAFGTVLLWFGCYLWSVGLSVVAAGALVVIVIAIGDFVVTYS